MFDRIDINLDGVKSGITAVLRREGKLFTNENGISLFSNFATLNGALKRSGLDYHLYKFQFYIEEGKYKFDLDDCYFDPNWSAYVPVRRDILIGKSMYIKEQIDEEVSKIGYIVTDKSGSHDEKVKDGKYEHIELKNLKYEYNKLKNLRRLAAFCIAELAKYSYYDFKISKDKFGSVISIGNSSAKVHIYTNSKVIDYNVIEKAKNGRVLPFDKNMDKFGTLYIFATCDTVDMKNEAVQNSIDMSIESIIQYMNQCCSFFNMNSVQYNPNTFKGYIKFDRKETLNEQFKGAINFCTDV